MCNEKTIARWRNVANMHTSFVHNASNVQSFLIVAFLEIATRYCNEKRETELDPILTEFLRGQTLNYSELLFQIVLLFSMDFILEL